VSRRNVVDNLKRSWLATIPAVGVALLPRLTCPCTLPAYAGLISSMGLGFLLKTAILLPLMAVSLVLAVAALGYRAERRRGFGPFAVGVAAAVVLMIGKFLMEPNTLISNTVVYGGIAALVGVSVWNSWPTRRAVPSETLLQLGTDIKGVRHGDEA